jgi:hypothetical protein
MTVKVAFGTDPISWTFPIAGACFSNAADLYRLRPLAWIAGNVVGAATLPD